MVSLRRGLGSLATFAIAVCLLSADANAQQVFGRIFGTVTDASGGAVQNAKVTITDQNKGTQFVVESNESGNYDKGQLIPGTYQVEVEATGFAKQQFKDIGVLVNAAAKVDAALQPGNVNQTVEVTAAAPTLQADRADVQTSFTSQQLIDLPSLGRNAQNYELLAPGTARIGFAHASSEDPQGSAQIQVNGQHFSSTGYELDGTVNQDPILGIVVINSNIDSLGEQKIVTQAYDAEFGYVAAGMVNSSTKSGTNDFHFTAFEYLRNNSPGFTSFGRDPFAEPNGAPPFKSNRFGGSLGGKIIKDKLFYFADAELYRQTFTGAVQTTVPLPETANGNFSRYLQANAANQIYDPATGNANGTGRQAFAGNLIPVSRLNRQALNIFRYFQQPNINLTGDPLLPNYAATGNGVINQNKWDVRSDYFMNEKTSFFGRYSNHQFDQGAPGAFGLLGGGPAFNGVTFAGNSFARNQSISIGTTHSFNPSLINEFRFGYMKYYVQTTPNGVGTTPARDAGIQGLNQDDLFYTSGLPQFQFRNAANDGNLTGLGYGLGINSCNCPLTESEGQYQFTDNVTKIAGNHNFKFGADIRYAKNLRVPSDQHRAGELDFNAQRTGFIQNAGDNPQGGLSFATFLLGDVTNFRRYVSTTTNAAEHQRRWFFYGQDSWRVTPKLTVNYGLRWELVFPEQVNGAGNGAQLDLSTGLINVFGVGNVSVHGVQKMNYKNFAPRLGIAYQITPKTVIRTGYAWSYALGTFGATFGHNVTQNPPVLSSQSANAPNAFSNVFNLANPAPALAPIQVPSSGQFILPDGIQAKARPVDTRLPRAEAYNFTVERQLDNATSLSIGYVGNVGRHVGRGSGDGFDQNVNQPSFIPGVSDQNIRRPYYNFIGANGLPLRWTQNIQFYCLCATSYYNSLQVQLRRSFKGGYATQISYTWQDAVSDSADDYTFLYNRPLGRGRQNAIPDHGLTIAQNFNIPFGRGRTYGSNINKWVDAFVGGWNISGITTFYSGLPFTPNLQNVSGRPDVGPGNRPSIGSGDPYAGNQSRSGWLNVGPGGTISNAFAVPAANTFGNYGFNTLRGPIFINQDVNLAKSFHVTEKLRWEIRAEAYNIFNHTNLGLPNSNVNGSNAGVIQAIAFGSNMRRMQFGTRFDF